MVRAHRRSPTSSFLLCSLLSDALGLPQLPPLEGMGNGCRPLPYSVRRVRDPVSCCGYQTDGSTLGPTSKNNTWRASTPSRRSASQDVPSGLKTRWRRVSRPLPFRCRRRPHREERSRRLRTIRCREGSWSKNTKLRAPQKTTRTREAGMPCQRSSSERPEQGERPR